MIIVGFDPGKDTGFAAARLDRNTAQLHLLDMRPMLFPVDNLKETVATSEMHTKFGLGIQDRIDLLSEDHGPPDLAVVENYLGGTGGTVQNSVNQIIGLIVGMFVFGLKQCPIRLQGNWERRPFLAQAKAITGKPYVYSKHSLDALAHVLLAAHNELGHKRYADLTIVPCELR